MTETIARAPTETWRETLKGFAAPTPFFDPKPLGDAEHLGDRASKTATIPAHATAALRAFSQLHDLGVETILRAAWALLLGRYSGERDVVFGVAGAPLEEALPFRAHVPPEAIALPWLLSLRDLEATFREHGDVSLAEVRESSEVLLDQPLFHSAFAIDHELKGEGQTLTVVATTERRTISVSIRYDTSCFDSESVARMLGHLQCLVESLVTNPDARIGTLGILTEGERRQLSSWNDTQRAYPRDLCLHGLVEAQVERTPDAIAVTFEDDSLTYRELDRRASHLAAHLVELGVGPDVLVGIEIERSLDMLVGLLGILKAGGAYLPLDPEYPTDRLAFMLADSAAPFLLTTQKMVAQLPLNKARVVCVDGDWVGGASEPSAPRRRSSLEDLAYVIYTSGSTGKPKGVQLRHRGVVSFMSSMRETPGISPEDRLLAVTTLSFDIAGLELFLPLTVGARVVIAGRSVISDGVALRKLLMESKATILQATPVTWRLLIGTGWSGSKNLKVLCGGEALARELADQLLERSASVWNLYGPTETTIWSSLSKVESGNRPIAIGRPIANTQMYVVDEYLKPVPIGVPGELLIGGVGVARGYLARPELTAEKFTNDTLSGEPGARLYRTGDLARQRPDGTFEHLGRLDFQVKIRGFRIELGEIEAALVAHPNVREAVVVAREDLPGKKRLVGYVIAKVKPAPGPGELRRYLLKTLSDYMIPSAFVMLDALPLTPNKKVDRRALPAPESSRPECERELRAPRDLLERQLIDAWEAALGVHPIGIDDDLFLDLGADSLAAIDCAAAIQDRLTTEVPPETLLQHRTVAAQAAFFRSSEPSKVQPRLATLRQGRSKPDLFLVHSAGADAFAYLPLVRKAKKADTAIHVLQNPYRYSGDGMFSSIEEMARDYVAVLQKHQPTGPYRLGGWSLGGSVAFEMANQLLAAGHEVAGLILFDAYRPNIAQRIWPRLQRTLSRWRYQFAHRFPRLGRLIPGTRAKLSALNALPPLARFSRLLRTLAYVGADDSPIFVELLFPGVFDGAILRGLKGDALWEHVYARVKNRSPDDPDLAFGIPGTTAASIRQRAHVFAAEHGIELVYAPRWVYPRPITMLNVRGSTTTGVAWRTFTSQPLEILEFDIKPTRDLPLIHTAMMQEENVALFAADFESFLAPAKKERP